MISVLLPTYKSELNIVETLKSLLGQTERDFEILLLDEPDSNDRTCQLVESLGDPRIRVRPNPRHLGLAETLNRGIELARGEYLARADAGDLYPPNRFEKQLAYMTAHPEVGVCGSWQHHFGRGTNRIHCVPENHEEIQANLLFNCEMCHSTVMMRKSVLQQYHLRYDDRFAAEDYELWCRAVQITKFHNLPEVLGEYRWDGNNITRRKLDRLGKESACLVARNIWEHLSIQVEEDQIPFLNGWQNQYAQLPSYGDYCKALLNEQKLLWAMWSRNEVSDEYEASVLRKVLKRRWYYATGVDKYQNSERDHHDVMTDFFRAHESFFIYYILSKIRILVKKRLKHS